MKHILVVDDDHLMLSVILRALPDFNVMTAPDGEMAMRLVAPTTPIDLLITDYLMPSMMGDELVGRLRAVRPELKVLVITGHTEILDREATEWWTTTPRLTKPFRLQDLRRTVIELVGEP